MTMMTTTASCMSFQICPAARAARSTWRRFMAMAFGVDARKVEHEIVDYLHRHQHDLPPELRIMLERRFLGP